MYVDAYALIWLLAETRYELKKLENYVMSHADDIEAVVAELNSAKEAIVAKVNELEAKVAAGEDLTQPLADLKASADALAAIVPPAAPAS